MVKNESKEQIKLLKRRLIDAVNKADVERTCLFAILAGVRIPGKVRPIADEVRRKKKDLLTHL